ncbi:MAG: hypothetical protein KDB00_08055 [Planctomycetales bacterium]|nr:hypothetical protein [Planctomycetales bacterium]
MKQRLAFLPVIVCLASLLFTGTSKAGVYGISHSFLANSVDNLGTGSIDINGTITTDGTLGLLSVSNITAWDLVFSNPGGTQTNFTLNQLNSVLDVSDGASLTATTTSLDFEIPLATPSFATFPTVQFSDSVGGPDILWRIMAEHDGTTHRFFTEVILDSDGNGALPYTRHLTEVFGSTTPLQGNLIGSGSGGSGGSGGQVPEPSSLLIWSLIGFVGMRRTRVKRA